MPDFGKVLPWLVIPCIPVFCGLACGLAPVVVPGYMVIKFFTPDYETSLIEGYKRPVIGLELCWRCKALKYRAFKQKIRHHDDYAALASSATEGCWCCRAIVEQLAIALQDAENPPVVLFPSDLKPPRLLMWFADGTWTKSGYLDAFKGISYQQYIFEDLPREIEGSPASDTSFDLVNQWLKTCDLEHQCFQGDGVPMPTRVIDVSEETPRLLVTNQLQDAYVALSHCWGNSQPLITTESTLQTRLDGIPMDSLPLMFQDAVCITRRIGMKYIWIDSLCIIQDSKQDWSQEAAKMGDVYRHSYLTLSALEATDCHQRILLPRSITNEKSSSLKTPIVKDDQETIFRRTKPDVFRTAALSQRAWALQERLLSPRILHYSKEEMFWECLACTANEQSRKIKPYRPSPYSYQRYECADVKKRLIVPAGEGASMPLSPASDWHIIVTEYTRCSLTKSTDKLPAISGLASMFERNTAHTYLAGLWKEDFRDGLLWFVPPDQLQPAAEPRRVPSWSWVSSDRPVHYPTIAGYDDTPRPTVWDLKLIDASIDLSTENPMGEVKRASLTVRGEMQEFSYETPIVGSPSRIYEGDGGAVCGTLYLDAVDEEPLLRKSCRGVRVTDRTSQRLDWKEDNTGPVSYSSAWTYFLIIVADDDSEDSWRRVGLMRGFRNWSFLRGSVNVQIRLV